MAGEVVDVAFLNQLHAMIDTPWNDHQAVESLMPTPPTCASSATYPAAFRQLAPAPVNPAAPGTRVSQTRQQAPQPSPPEPLREQDRLLPMANVARLMASELPNDAKISRDAKLLMQEMVSEFICFVTSEANDLCMTSGHKAISQSDLLNALDNLDLACFLPVRCLTGLHTPP